MKLDRAISEFQEWEELGYHPDLRPHTNAIKLSIEAMKRLQSDRLHGRCNVALPLPGETLDLPCIIPPTFPPTRREKNLTEQGVQDIWP